MRILTDIGVTDIQNREVSFQNGLLRAKAIFQRHNYQLYQVFCPHFNNPLGVDPSTESAPFAFAVRVPPAVALNV